jgi:AcrR family transcriptional regulator
MTLNSSIQPPRRRGRPPTGAREAILAAALDIIRSDGLAHATTREIAARAGTSEASIHYHFGGKAGLLEAVVVDALGPLEQLDREPIIDQPPDEMLITIGSELERFFERIVPVLVAVQSDADLRRSFTERIAAHDRGPYRGVRLIERNLKAIQDGGTIPPGTDVAATALLLVGASFLRAWQQRFLAPGQADPLPDLHRAVAALLHDARSTRPR